MSGGRQAAMSHHYFPLRTTTFDSSGQNYFFKWYIKGLWSVIFKNQKLICGPEGEMVVAHGRLPSPAH